MRAIDEATRAKRARLLIERNPARGDDGQVGIVFTRPKIVTKNSTTPAVQLARQMVRVVADNRATPVEGVAGAAPTRAVIIYGVRNHPDPLIQDTDINEGYTATINGDHYRVVDVLLVPGGVQALARVMA